MTVSRLLAHVFCLVATCGFAAGCVTEQKTEGSFATGGAGKYGHDVAASSTAKTTSKSKGKGDTDYTPGPKLQLALAQYQEQRGFRDEARKSYEQLLAADSKSIDAIIGLARLDQVGGRTAEAEAGFQKAVRMDSQSGRGLDALGQFYVDQKRSSEAVATLQRALATDPADKTIRFHYGIALARSGQVAQSTPYLVEAVGAAAAHYNIGLILHERGELAASEEQFVAAILDNPRLEQAQYWLNEVRRERDQLQLTGATGDVRPAGHRAATSGGAIEQPAVTDRGPRR